MGTRSKSLLIGGALVTLLAAAVLSASAASLGGINTASLFAQSGPASIVPPIASDTFEGCHSHLDGWVDSVGNVWTSHEGNWTCVGSSVARNQQRVSVAHATVDTGLTDNISISTDIVRISSQKNKSGPGLALLDDGTNFIAVLFKREEGRLVLGVSRPSGFNLLAEVDPISDFDNVVLTAEIQQPLLTIKLDGTAVLTYDLNGLAPADQTLLTNTRHGLASDNDNWSHFGSFAVQEMP